MEKNAKFIAKGALIAALYVIFTYIPHLLGLANGLFQIRISEALLALAAFTPAAVPGLFIGCVIANLITGAAIWDVIFGSLATLIGAFFAYKLRKTKYIFLVPNIISNTVIVPLLLKYVYMLEEGLPYIFLMIFLGELVSCGILGKLLHLFISRNKPVQKLVVS